MADDFVDYSEKPSKTLITPSQNAKITPLQNAKNKKTITSTNSNCKKQKHNDWELHPCQSFHFFQTTPTYSKI